MSNLETHLREQAELTADYERRELESRQPKRWSSALAEAVQKEKYWGKPRAPQSVTFDLSTKLDRTAITLTLTPEQVKHLADASERMGYHDGDEALAADVASMLRAAVDQTHDPDFDDLDPDDDEDEGPEQRPFNVFLGVSVRAYGTATVMATSMAEAVEIVRQHALHDAMIETIPDIEYNVWDQVSDCEWDTSSDYTILSVEDEEGDEETIDDHRPHGGSDAIGCDGLIFIDLCPDGPNTIIDADELRALVTEIQSDKPQPVQKADLKSHLNALIDAESRCVVIPTHGGGDPDGENHHRRDRGRALMFADAQRSASEQLTDTLVNLMHGAASLRLDFAANLRLACSHFEAETAKEPKA